MLLALTGQADVLTDIAKQREIKYATRTELNIQLRDAKGVLAQTPQPEPDVPRQQIATDVLLEEKNQRQNIIDSNRIMRERLQSVIHLAGILDNKIQETRAELARLLAQRAERTKDYERFFAEVNAQVNPDMDSIDAQIRSATERNREIAMAIAYDAAANKVDQFTEFSQALTHDIEELDKQRDAILQAAQFPVPGLGVNDDDVTLDGMPFEQLSNSQQNILGAAIGIAYNPRLRVILIDEGSGIQGETLMTIAALAEKAGAQIFMASAAHDEQATVVIEDGIILKREE
jgi:hypothetical protein